MSLLVNSFIAIYLIISWSWSLPTSSPARKLLAPLRPVILYLGLWHNWKMFAPDPVASNRRLQALLDFGEGSVDVLDDFAAGEPKIAARLVSGSGEEMAVEPIKRQDEILEAGALSLPGTLQASRAIAREDRINPIPSQRFATR